MCRGARFVLVRARLQAIPGRGDAGDAGDALLPFSRHLIRTFIKAHVSITHPKSDLLHLLHLRHPEGSEAERWKLLDPVVLVMQAEGREQSIDELL
jgi:hypothetical protein